MRRADKLALLTRILSGQAAGQTRKQLSPSLGRGAVVIIYQPGDNTNPGPDDVVSFYHKGEQVSIPFKEIKAFTRYDPLTITWMPDNHRRKRDKAV